MAFGGRAILTLALTQALGMSAILIMMVTSALVGEMLATDKSLATLPLGLQSLAVMASTFPAAFLMKRRGRRFGFVTGALFGLVGGVLMLVAVYRGSFPLFVLGNGIFGVAMSFQLFYRFAAAEAAEEAFRPKAISMVMAGGVIAAVLGPFLAQSGERLLSPFTFAGSLLFVVALMAMVVLLLLTLRMPGIAAEADAGMAETSTARPLALILMQPRAIAAVAASVFGFSIMTFVMTATPLSMKACGFGLESGIAFVIQFHALGMFAPSFVTGHLIRRCGEFAIMTAGLLCYLATVAIGLLGAEIHHFWWSLLLLGIGWNFLYIGGTSLLTHCYRPAERAKVQATNDTLTFAAVTLCSFIAGAVEQLAGWSSVLTAALAPILLVALALAFGRWGRGMGRPMADIATR